MLKIYIQTVNNITYPFVILDRTNFSLDYYIGIVCNEERCPKSAIKRITFYEV